MSKNIDNQLYKYPASIDYAQHHKNCYLTGSKIENRPDCRCCDGKQRNSLNYTFQKEETYQKGSGIAIFFQIMIYLCILMLVKFLLTDLPRIVNTNQQQFGVNVTIWQQLSRTEQGYAISTQVFNLITVILFIVLALLLRRRQLRIQMDVDRIINSQNDYNLYVENIPLMFEGIADLQTTVIRQFQKKTQTLVIQILNRPQDSSFTDKQQDIIELHRKIGNKNSGNIVCGVNAIYDISRIQHIRQMEQDITQKILVAISQKDNNLAQKQTVLLNQLIKTKQQELRQFQNSDDIGSQISYFTGKVFLTFSYQIYRAYVLQHYKKNPAYWDFQGLGVVKMTDADNPSSILWQNMHYTKGQLRRRWVIAVLAGLMFIFYSLIIIFFLYKYKHEQDQKGSDIKATIIGGFISLFITLTNIILDSIIFELVDYMKSPYVAYFKFRYVAFSLIAKFINTSIIALAMQLILYHQYYGLSGLFPYITQLLVINAAVSVAKGFFYVPKIKRWAFIKLANFTKHHAQGYLSMTQGQLNKLYQQPLFPIQTNYTSALNVLLTVMFFSWASPYLSLIAFFQFLGQQLLYRWHYSSMSSQKNVINLDLSWQIAFYMEIGILMFAISNLLFPQLLQISYQKGIVITQVVLASLYIAFIRILPQKKLQKLLCMVPDISQTSYKQVKSKLPQTYEQFNPSYP